MNNDLTLLAQYENRKLFLKINYRVHGELCGLDQAFVFAIANDVFPIFHHTHIPNEGIIDPYFDLYKVKESDFKEVLYFMDNEMLEKRLYTFYDIEDKFGGRDRRCELIDMFRYTYLDRRFDQKFWDYLLSRAPAEAGHICDKFSDCEL